jgi:hypothetical protein
MHMCHFVPIVAGKGRGTYWSQLFDRYKIEVRAISIMD